MKKICLVAVFLFFVLQQQAFCAANELQLVSRILNWQPGISPKLETDVLNAGTNPVAAFVKFNAPLSPANHDLLQNSKVRLEEYLTENAYSLLILSKDFVTNAAIAPLVFSAES